MLLTCRILADVTSVNSWDILSQAEINFGDSQTLYFQLVDSALDRSEQHFKPSGRRYMPATSSTLSVTFQNIDDAKRVVRAATQPFPQDASIWGVPLLSSDPFRGTVNVRMVLSEPSRNLTVGPLVLRVR